MIKLELNYETCNKFNCLYRLAEEKKKQEELEAAKRAEEDAR